MDLWQLALPCFPRSLTPPRMQLLDSIGIRTCLLTHSDGLGDDETSVEFFQRLLLDIGDVGGGRLDVQRLGAWMFERVDEFGLGPHFASSEMLCDELEHEVAIMRVLMVLSAQKMGAHQRT